MEKFPFITTPQKSTKRQKAKGSAIPTKRGGADALVVRTGQTTIQLNKLPKVLSSSIKEKNLNIFEIPSPDPDTGFNAITWRDKDGSKLYLENLDSEGTILLGLKVTYPDVQSLGKMSGWPNSLPDTIYVKSAGGSDKRMAAKKMVLGLLNSYQNSVKPPKPIILKETQTDNVGPGKLAIQFSVKGITQKDPIMMQDVYRQEITIDTRYAARFGLMNLSPMLGPIDEALTSYQEKLQAGVVNGFRVEEVDAPEARAMFQEIESAAKILKARIEGLDAPVLDKLKTLKTLKEQVESAINDGFKNEFDTRRWRQWLDPKLNPLTEDVIVPGTGKEIGAGAQGSVFKYELDPASERSPVVLKYDSNGLNSQAKNAGIPEENPQQSVRAMAAFKISEHLNLGIIPQTEFFVGTDDDGRPKLGQAMEFVNGAIGQRSVGLKGKEIIDRSAIKDIQDLEDIVKNPGKHTQFEFENARDTLYMLYVKVKGKWYSSDIFPVDINYNNRFVQKGLSDLQVFDYIIGHADRNAGNWIYEKDNTGSIIGVKGIDNDDTFGEKWLPRSENPGWSSKTPDIPPIVDISTALSILNADFNDIRPLLAGLSDGEINKAGERFDEVQRQVVQRVRDGTIASMGDVGDQAKLEELRKLTNMPAQPGILRWGNQGIADTHIKQNSYLGYQLARRNELAQQYPGSRGVIPESGDALV